MKLKEIKALKPDDVNKLSNKELRQVISKLATQGNRQLKKLEDAGISDFSSAYDYIMNETGGRFGASGKKTRGELLREFYRAKTFVYGGLKTTTVRGTEKYIDKMSSVLGMSKDEFKKLNDKSMSNFWKSYRKFQEKYHIQKGKDSEQAVKEAINKYKKDKRKTSSLFDEELIRKVRQIQEEEMVAIDETNKREFYDFIDEESDDSNPFE